VREAQDIARHRAATDPRTPAQHAIRGPCLPESRKAKDAAPLYHFIGYMIAKSRRGLLLPDHRAQLNALNFGFNGKELANVLEPGPSRRSMEGMAQQGEEHSQGRRLIGRADEAKSCHVATAKTESIAKPASVLPSCSAQRGHGGAWRAEQLDPPND